MSDQLPTPAGRPSLYTPELRDEICRRLARGRTLRSVCSDDDMPDRQTIYNWLNQNIGLRKDETGNKVLEEGFFDHYTRAREIGLDEIADETLDIADDSKDDWMEIPVGRGQTKTVVDKEAVLRSKLRVETRFEYLANMAPRKYGKNVKVQSQALDKNGDPTDPATQTDHILTAAFTLLEKAKNDEAKKG